MKGDERSRSDPLPVRFTGCHLSSSSWLGQNISFCRYPAQHVISTGPRDQFPIPQSPRWWMSWTTKAASSFPAMSPRAVHELSARSGDQERERGAKNSSLGGPRRRRRVPRMIRSSEVSNTPGFRTPGRPRRARSRSLSLSLCAPRPRISCTNIV